MCWNYGPLDLSNCPSSPNMQGKEKGLAWPKLIGVTLIGPSQFFLKQWSFPNRSIKVLPILGNPLGTQLKHIRNSPQKSLFPAPSPQVHWAFPLAV